MCFVHVYGCVFLLLPNQFTTYFLPGSYYHLHLTLKLFGLRKRKDQISHSFNKFLKVPLFRTRIFNVCFFLNSGNSSEEKVIHAFLFFLPYLVDFKCRAFVAHGHRAKHHFTQHNHI